MAKESNDDAVDNDILDWMITRWENVPIPGTKGKEMAPCTREFKTKPKSASDRRGHPGRGDRGACGGSRRRDGSGAGRGNRFTPRQPKGK